MPVDMKMMTLGVRNAGLGKGLRIRDEMVQKLRKVAGVEQAFRTSGRFDLVVMMQAKDDAGIDEAHAHVLEVLGDAVSHAETFTGPKARYHFDAWKHPDHVPGHAHDHGPHPH